MSEEERRIEKIVNQHKSHLRSISDEIIKGTLEGIKEGLTDGLKRGIKDGLKDCFVKGFINIGEDDIGDILEDIPEEIIKNVVKEGAKYIFENSTEDYLQRICQKIVDGIQKEDIKLSKDQTGDVLDRIRRSQQEALKNMMERLPNNPFLREVMAGMQTAWEESLEKTLKACEEKIQKEIANKS